MKKRNVTLWSLVLGCLFGANLFAQVTVNYPTVGSSTFTITPPNSCSFNFFDNGGAAANYSNAVNQLALNNSVTFAPSAAANKIQATFTAFATEGTFDALYVWDGANMAAPQIASANGIGSTPLAGGWWITTAPNNFGANVVRATAGNASGALTFSFTSDGSVTCAGWAATVVEILPGACAMTAPANVTTSTSAGVCAANSVTVAAPTFSPAGCNSAFSLQYRVNGGAPVVIGSVVPATVSLLNIPKGVNTISWELVNPCGGGLVSSASSTITVVDLTPPVITCPANVTINLGPGECAATYSYNVTATDNCPLFGPIATLNVPQAGSNAFNGITFDVRNDGTLPIRITSFTAPISNGVHPVVAYYTTSATTAVGNQANAAAWTLMGGPVNVTGNGAFPTWPTFTNIPIGGLELAPGQRKGIYLAVTDGGEFGYMNNNFTTTDGTMTVISQGHGGGQYPFINANNPRAFFGSVSYQTSLLTPPVTQTAGLPSGSEFPIGTTQNCFTTVDAAGLTASCCFSVTVNEYPNATNSLACNDLVQISLDENCSAVVNADQVLEGGPYRCYDNYIVEVDRTINGPAANGPWTPAVLGVADVGKTYYYRVTDPVTGNSCWGQIKIEDKLPPVLVCRDITVQCNEVPDPNNGPAPGITGPQSIIYTGLSDIIENTTSPLNYSFDFNYIPAGAPVLDVDCRLKLTGHTFLPDLNIEVISPSGQTISVFQLGGCTGAEWPIDVVFDDEGTGNLTLCVQLNVGGAPIQCVSLPGVSTPNKLAGFDGSNAGGTWTVRVSDSFAQDDGVVEEVGLIITVDLPAIPVTDNCAGELTLGNGLSYVDQHTPGSCAGAYGTTIRTWTAVDPSGNVSTCNQTITFVNPDLADVVLPPDYDGVDNPYISCEDGAYPTPEWLNGVGLQGTPTLYGSTFGCTINWEYDDLVLPVCDGTYKIKRTWTIVDWCAGTGFDYVQLIKVHDDQGPAIACPANMTVSTDPYNCCATVDLPDVIISDNCSRINNVGGYVVGFDPYTGAEIGTFPFGGSLTTFPGNNLWASDTLANFGQTVCLPLGQHVVYYEAEDDCGNVSTCSFRLTVRDYTPPVAACDEYTVVGIGLDDPFDCYWPNAKPGDCNAGGTTWVKATTFDDGSYDNCGDVHFTVRRMGPDYSDCILALNATNGFDVNGSAPDGNAPNCFDPFADFPSEFERAISEYDSIKFYCCEVGTTQTVVLRVYQVDDNGNFSIGPDGSPIFNECMVQVEVQDKIKPACQAPANVTVSCEAFDPSLWAYGNAVPSDNCCLDTTKVYQGQCGLTHTTVLTQFDSLCNKGTITRRWTAYDCHGLTSQCTQRIVVQYEQDYYVKFPADRLVSTCDGTGNYGAPEFYGEDCELLATSFDDVVFTVVPDACFKIERTWTVINWCTYNPNLPCIEVPNPNPSNTTNAPANLAGVTVSACGNTVLNWNPTVVKINPSDPVATNYCTFWDANANCYKYKQIIKVYDTQDPTVVTPTPAEFCDYSANDAAFWNASYWWDATISSHDLCEGDANIEITATDACSGANISFRYLLFLDLDGDGVMETVINSVNPPGTNNVQYNNYQAPNYIGGESRQFDFRSVPFNQKWGFGLQTDAANGNNRTARVRWFNQLGQNAVPQLPYGNHKIKWFIEDGCGNEAIVDMPFVVKDCKKPTVVCLNGLSVNLMNTSPAMVQLWASDFLQYTEDNCTPSAQLKIAIRRSGTGTGFPTNPDGTPQTGVTFDCNDLGTQLVELWSIDKAGNADFCETYVLIQDNMGVCGTNVTVAGALKTPTATEGVEAATVELAGTSNGIPMFSELFSDVAGSYEFPNALPLSSNATVTPTLELDPLNGVNTFDLILISRHILGLEPLNTPYKLIAADANKSGTVTTFDVVELRKLILGTYTELPGNSSWRFVDASQTFANPQNPFAEVIRENLTIAAIQQDVNNGDFKGVKVGDVDETATPNNLVSTDDRTAGTLLFDVEDRNVKAGEQFSVNFKAADKAQGYQFTMNLNNLEVVNIVPGAKMSAENFGVFADAITTSADGTDGEFTVNFRAKADGQLSQMIGVSSRITKAVAFDATSSKLDVAFRFNKGGVSTIAGVGFELYQNSPNPFVNKTFVGFHLPEATAATLTVYDETGRALYTTTGDFAKGYNAISLDRANLRANGVLYYKLETSTDSATKKMIQSK